MQLEPVVLISKTKIPIEDFCVLFIMSDGNHKTFLVILK